MEKARFRIGSVFTLMTMAAVSTTVATVNHVLLAITIALWIGAITSLVCLSVLTMPPWRTFIVAWIVLDLCGACLTSFGSWAVRSSPNIYPNSISLGDPATSFLIGFIVLSPIAGALAICSTGIAWLVLKNTLHTVTIERRRAADDNLWTSL